MKGSREESCDEVARVGRNKAAKVSPQAIGGMLPINDIALESIDLSCPVARV